MKFFKKMFGKQNKDELQPSNLSLKDQNYRNGQSGITTMYNNSRNNYSSLKLTNNNQTYEIPIDNTRNNVEFPVIPRNNVEFPVIPPNNNIKNEKKGESKKAYSKLARAKKMQTSIEKSIKEIKQSHDKKIKLLKKQAVNNKYLISIRTNKRVSDSLKNKKEMLDKEMNKLKEVKKIINELSDNKSKRRVQKKK